jgi:O-antigen ligase
VEQPILLLVALIAGTLGLLAFGIFVSKPGHSILPIYAATLPVASAIDLSLPLPSPFDTLSSLLGGLAIGACLCHLVLTRKGSIPTLPVALWSLLVAWTAAGVFWAEDAREAFRTVTIAVPLVLLMALVSALPRDQIDFVLLRAAVMLSGLIVGAYGLGLRIVGAAFPMPGDSERFAIASDPGEANPNIVAATLLLPLVMSLEGMIMGERRWKAFGAVSVLFTIFQTASRGGMIAAGVAMVLTVFFCSRAPGGRRLVGRAFAQVALFFAGISLLTVIVVTFGPARTTERIETRFLRTPIERLERRDSSGRLEIWQTGLLACKIHCAFGAGPDNFPEVYNQLSAFSGSARYAGANRPAHNILISLAVEAGVVGLSLFALALGAEWVTLSQPRVRNLSPALRAALLAMLAANFFLSLLWYKYIWMIFTLIRAAETSSTPDPASEHPSPLSPLA